MIRRTIDKPEEKCVLDPEDSKDEGQFLKIGKSLEFEKDSGVIRIYQTRRSSGEEVSIVLTPNDIVKLSSFAKKSEDHDESFKKVVVWVDSSNKKAATILFNDMYKRDGKKLSDSEYQFNDKEDARDFMDELTSDYNVPDDEVKLQESKDESRVNTADIYPQAGPELRDFITSFAGSDHKSDADDLSSEEDGIATDQDLIDAATPRKTDSLIKPDTEVIDDPNAVQNQNDQDSGVTASDITIPFALTDQGAE